MYLVLCSTWAFVLLGTVGLAFLTRRRLPVAVAIAVATFAVGIVVCHVAYPLYGLEYEDAFEYVYNGLLAQSGAEGVSAHTTMVVAAGSLEEPRALASLSHPPGAAAYWAMLIWFFGTLEVARAASVAMVGALGLGVTLLALGQGRMFALAASVLIFVSSPFLAYYTTTGFAEVPASLLVAITLFGLSCAYELRPSARVLSLMLLAAACFLLPITKREMAVIPIGLALRAAYQYLRTRSPFDRSALLAIVMGFTVAIWEFREVLLNVDLVRTSELDPFSIQTLTHLGPLWLQSALSNWRYGLWGLALIAGIGGAFAGRRDRTLALAAIAVLIVSLGFSQSYYYGTAREIPWLHFERYSFALWPIALTLWHNSFALLVESRLRSLRVRRWMLVVLGVGAGLGSGATLFLASARYSEECRVRFDPTRSVMTALGDDDWVVTPNPILASLIDPRANVADLTQLDSDEVRSVLESSGRRVRLLVALSESDSLDALQRYPGAMAVLRDMELHGIRRDLP